MRIAEQLRDDENATVPDEGEGFFCVSNKGNMFKISKGYSTVSKTIHIPEPVAEQLERLAGENNISFNQLINQCIQFAMDHMSSEKEPAKAKR